MKHSNDNSRPDRQIVNRRDLLQVGALSLSTSVLPQSVLGANRSVAETAGRARSVIFLWMGGGFTHIDSFDPKPEAPEEIRGELTAISTNLPGVQFCETMPHLAKMADQLAVVRSFSHDSNDHLLSQVYTLSGRKVGRTQLFSEPNIGAIVSYLHGSRNGLPGYIAVPGITRPGPPPHNLFVGGWLGNQYAPFAVGGQPDQPDFTVGEKAANPPVDFDEDLTPKVLRQQDGLPLGRLSGRASLRQDLEQSLQTAERQKYRDVEGHYQNAIELLTSNRIREAFDINKESDAIRDSYGRTKIGGRCLLASRLVEAGARFVMVDYGYDPDYGNLWDNHNALSQKNFPHISKMSKRGYHVAGCDKAFAGLIQDLKTRGLLDSTLVVFLTEFGRTPKINARGGRDHWGACGSVFFTGAATQVGQVIGQSDQHAAYPITRGYTPADLAATIYDYIGIDPETRIRDLQNRPMPVLDHGEKIEGLV